MGATWKAIRALSLPRKLLLGAALVFAIAGLTIGLLTTGGRTPRAPSATIASRTEGAPSAHVRGDLAIAASYLGTSRARLRSELRSGRTLAQIAFATTGKSVAGLVGAIVAERTARIEAALAEHRLDSAKERARLKSLPRRVAVEVERSRPQAAHPGGLLSAAAHYLDLTPDQLLSALRSGRTLAQLASKRPGKSTAGLIAVLVASERARIKAALAAGKLTREKADAALAKLEQHVSARVNRPLKEHRARRAARASEGATEGA